MWNPVIHWLNSMRQTNKYLLWFYRSNFNPYWSFRRYNESYRHFAIKTNSEGSSCSIYFMQLKQFMPLYSFKVNKTVAIKILAFNNRHCSFNIETLDILKSWNLNRYFFVWWNLEELLYTYIIGIIIMVAKIKDKHYEIYWMKFLNVRNGFGHVFYKLVFYCLPHTYF